MAESGTTIKILIYHNLQLFRELMFRCLTQIDTFEVVALTNNTPEMIEECRLFNPDIVLMDICVPINNGINKARNIHKEFPDSKIIVITTLEEETCIRAALDAEVKGYFLINNSFETLIEAIYQVYAGNNYFSPQVESIIIKQFLGQTVNTIDQLSKREFEVLKYIAEGKSINEIADILFISAKTVSTHKQNIFNKLNINNMTQVVRFAMSHGIIS